MNRPFKSLHRQRGISGVGWLGLILLFGFGILCGAKIAPSYFDNWKIRDSLRTLGELSLTENEFQGASDAQVKSHLGKYFQVNGIPSEQLKDLKITRKKGRTYVDLNWERRVEFIANIDVVMKFENQFDSLNPTACCRYREDNSKNAQ